jgi:hypothetical protein
MAQLTSRAQLKKYCLEKLGEPVIEINVADSQVESRIDDAIEFMVEYNYNMIEKKYLSIQVTQQIIDDNFLTVPEEVLAVSRIMPIRNSSVNSSNYLFDIQYHLTANDLLNTVGTGDVSSYYITKQHIATIQDVFNAKSQHEFRRYTDKLHFKFDADVRLFVGDYIVLECHTPIEQASRFWNDRLLRNYATQLIKRQWGGNLSKFQNVQLPGGIILNGTELYNQAQLEIDKMETESVYLYSEPDELIIG